MAATIAPYQELETRSGPRRARRAPREVRGRRSQPRERAGRVRLLRGRSENACRFKFAEPTVTAAPGRRAGTAFSRSAEEADLDRPACRPALPDLGSRTGLRCAAGIAAGRVPPETLDCPLGPAGDPDSRRGRGGRLPAPPHNRPSRNSEARRSFAAQEAARGEGLALGEVTPSDRKTQKRKLVGKIRGPVQAPRREGQEGHADRGAGLVRNEHRTRCPA